MYVSVPLFLPSSLPVLLDRDGFETWSIRLVILGIVQLEEGDHRGLDVTEFLRSNPKPLGPILFGHGFLLKRNV